MNRIKGFNIVAILFLIIIFCFISISVGQEMTDEEYNKQYNESLLHEINIPVDVITRIDKENDDTLLFEDLRESYLMTDIFKNYSFTLFLGYNEMVSKEKLEIEKIILNREVEVKFMQEDSVFKHRTKNKSFVVFPLDPQFTMSGKNVIVTIYYKPNKENIIRRELVIYSSQIDNIFNEIEEWYKEHEMKKPKMKV